MGDAEGQRADAKSQEANTEALVVAQRLAELLQGQEATPKEFSWGRLSAGESRRVTQCLQSDAEQWKLP